MAAPQVRDTVTLPDLLAVLAQELAGIAQAGRLIEDRVSFDPGPTAMRGDGALAALQGLDHLVQTASELARFLQAVAAQSDRRVHVHVAGPAAEVRLRVLALALAGRTGPDDTAPPGPAAGEVELF